MYKVEICGVNTKELPVVPDRELKGYFEKIRAGDTDARDAFVRGNLRLVLSIIQRFAMRGENMDDLFQVGCVGLLKAIDRFDITMDVRFSTYAVPMISGEVRRYLRDYNPVRVSRSLRDTAYKAFAVRNELADSNEAEPTIEQIAKHMDMKAKDVAYAVSAVQDPVSLYEPVYRDSGDTLYVMDSIADEKNADEIWLTSLALKDIIDKLSVKEKDIVQLRFFEGKTQMEVAREIGISHNKMTLNCTGGRDIPVRIFMRI